MTDQPIRLSSLAALLLSLLAEEPLHPYAMRQRIRSRHKDDVVNITQGNSVYQTIERLVRMGLARISGTTRVENRPERTVYEITEAGRTALRDWLAAAMASPAREFPEFPVALALAPRLPVALVEDCLAIREQALLERVAGFRDSLAEAGDTGLPRLFVIEIEYAVALAEAERRWVAELREELRAGAITWNEEWLRSMADRSGLG